MKYRCHWELTKYEQGFEEALCEQGYTKRSITRQLGVLVHLDGWLESQSLVPAQLGADRIGNYVTVRQRQGHRLYRSVRCLSPLLSHLREKGAIPQEGESADPTPCAQILSSFRHYLVEERRLKAETADHYKDYASRFLSDLPAPVLAELSLLAARDVVAGVRCHCRSRGHSWVKNFTSALRSLLHYLFLNGDVPRDLAGSVLPAAGWGRRGLPKALDEDEVGALLRQCSRRDTAIMILALRLGLRSAEVAALTLADLDWQAGEVLVHGKGDRVDRLPLPGDVGDVIVDYVSHERPPTMSCSVFIKAVAPLTGISGKTVEGIVQRAGRRAGLGPIGPHRLRHTAATQFRCGNRTVRHCALARIRAPADNRPLHPRRSSDQRTGTLADRTAGHESRSL
jgi:integrase/recombinase XerD